MSEFVMPERYLPTNIGTSGAWDGFAPAAELLDEYELVHQELIAVCANAFVTRRARRGSSASCRAEMPCKSGFLCREVPQHRCIAVCVSVRCAACLCESCLAGGASVDPLRSRQV